MHSGEEEDAMKLPADHKARELTAASFRSGYGKWCVRSEKRKK